MAPVRGTERYAATRGDRHATGGSAREPTAARPPHTADPPFATAELRDLYRKRARAYDLVTRIYRRFGFRDTHWRERAAGWLALEPGNTALDLACGTGLNFPALQARVGPSGRIVGVDLTDAMLARAGHRVARAGWQNVTLLEEDLAHWSPPPAHGIVSTLALSLVASYERVVERAAAALLPGGRLAVLDLKLPARWPPWLVRMGARLNRGYGVTLGLHAREPWMVIRRTLREVHYEELFGGSLYLLVAEKDPA
ncbi:MAG: methyltransferase domain-containing protein [Gemmatimonadota bacterium]